MFGRNKNQAAIAEGVLKVGTWATPEDIGTNNIDPITYFTGDELGIFKQGSNNVTLPREFAELLSGTPAILEAKDLTRKSFIIESMLNQINIDILELVFGLLTQKAYSITSPLKTIDIAHIGSNEPPQVTKGYLLDTYLRDGRRFYIGMYAGRATSEDLSLAWSGSEHVGVPLKVEAFPHINFSTSCTDSQKHYGVIVIDSTVVCA